MALAGVPGQQYIWWLICSGTTLCFASLVDLIYVCAPYIGARIHIYLLRLIIFMVLYFSGGCGACILSFVMLGSL
jgi:hypothetical protein